MSANLIKQFALEPHPGGGFYREFYQSSQRMSADETPRAIGSAHYFYLSSDDYLAWHRVDCDILWQFYLGSDVILHTLNEQGELHCTRLGNPRKALVDITQQLLVPANTWIAAEIGCEHAHALLGFACFPAFILSQLSIADTSKLAKQFPDHRNVISRLAKG